MPPSSDRKLDGFMTHAMRLDWAGALQPAWIRTDKAKTSTPSANKLCRRGSGGCPPGYEQIWEMFGQVWGDALAVEKIKSHRAAAIERRRQIAEQRVVQLKATDAQLQREREEHRAKYERKRSKSSNTSATSTGTSEENERKMSSGSGVRSVEGKVRLEPRGGRVER
ncbi:MAG: hypothetical protein M1817_001107 [Caeruleum heppii]|nr:MAG: hypothetical protein M1817_001107 [Caeruleum heppii]